MRRFSLLPAVILVTLCPPVLAQQIRGPVANVVVPQSRTFRATDPADGATVKLESVDVHVRIVEQVATTTMTMTLANPYGRPLQAEVLAPVPDSAALRGFAFEGAAEGPTAELLRKDEARRTYEQIVAKLRDPALLEFADCGLVRSSVFSVPPGAKQKVQLTYESLATAAGDRVDYVLPRSESIAGDATWTIAVEVISPRGIATAYSPSHEVLLTRRSAGNLLARVPSDKAAAPGPFRLSYLLAGSGMTASTLAYPNENGTGGYFLLFAGVPIVTDPDVRDTSIRREITLVIDRSGSMKGRKIEQARNAAKQVLAGMDAQEWFNLIIYNSEVQRFCLEPLRATGENVERANAFIDNITANGNTNLYEALGQSLSAIPASGSLPIVLFLTDGLPTVGNTSEAAIRDLAMKVNPFGRRVYTFGVGVDVNTPLLEKVAYETRASATFVLPNESVEDKVANVFEKLDGPVLADAELRVLSGDGTPAPGRVIDAIPGKLPDLFVDGQLVVLGRYVGNDPITFELAGNYRGEPRRFRFGFDPPTASIRNGFVPRLWASRKIGLLIDEIRQLGADPDALAAHHTTAAAIADPRIRELVESVISLSTEFGILSEYTAFLALEGTDLTDETKVLAQATDNFVERAVKVRSGTSSVNQSENIAVQKRQSVLNSGNYYYDQGMNRVSIADVRQVSDRAFYRRGGRWVDSRSVNKSGGQTPDCTVDFGSPEYERLANRLIAEGRQSILSLRGEIVLEIDGQRVLIRGVQAK